MDLSVRTKGVYVFGPFRLDPARRVLLRDEAEVALPPRLFDTLMYLVENAGRVVERNELLRVVWGGRVVEERNVNQTIFSLRRALQTEGGTDRYIVTAPMRGYRFVAPVHFDSDVVGTDPAVTEAVVAVPEPAADRPRRAWPRRLVLLAGAAFLLASLAWVARERAGRTQADFSATAAFAPPPHSVAVLAFENMSGDSTQAYFSDGISEELIDTLSRVRGLQVAARSSAFTFKHKSATVAEIGRQLNVRAVLEGSVRRVGARLRITAQLVDATTGYNFWSRSYDRDQGDILRLQADIAETVASSLQVSLMGDRATGLAIGGTANAQAFDYYLRGLPWSKGATAAAAKQALSAFEKAIAIDPDFAQARVYHAVTLFDIAGTWGNADLGAIRKAQSDALADIAVAISLAPELGAAHAALAYLLISSFDFGRAKAEYTRAFELAPGDARINLGYGTFQMELGNVAAGVAAAEHAVRLDPLSPATYASYAVIMIGARRYHDAVAALRHAEQLQGGPSSRVAAIAGVANLLDGHPDAARQGCAAERDYYDYLCLALADRALGRPAEASAELAKLQAERGDTMSYQYAEIYAQWGRPADAARWLETAFRTHDGGLAQIKGDPLLDPIRDTSEFKDIVRRLNFPQ
jgi:TolB-like protein/DNA-binding winged helix-turn-helix (wHTH) protein